MVKNAIIHTALIQVNKANLINILYFMTVIEYVPASLTPPHIHQLSYISLLYPVYVKLFNHSCFIYCTHLDMFLVQILMDVN